MRHFLKGTHWLIISILLLPASLQCQQKKNSLLSNNPAGYDISKPQIISLGKDLEEISGIYAAGQQLYAISDDKGHIYKIDLSNPTLLESWKFDKSRNYEDVLLINNTIYVLNSNGDLVSFDLPLKEPINPTRFKFPFEKGEFEILYYDPGLKQIMLICKDCENDKKKSVTVYSFDPVSLKYSKPSFLIDAKKIAEALGKKDVRFKPSAATIRPGTNDVYIISSINKLLVIASTTGDIKQVVQLNPGIFKQPEGIAFTAAGDMIISNESAGKGSANLLVFKLKK